MLSEYLQYVCGLPKTVSSLAEVGEYRTAIAMYQTLENISARSL